MQGRQYFAAIHDDTLNSIRARQNRIRDPSLTALPILELCAIFFAAPLAASFFRSRARLEAAFFEEAVFRAGEA